MGDQVVGAGVFAVDPPGASASGESWCSTRGVAESVPPSSQLRGDGQRGGFEIVAVVAGRPSESVPLCIDFGGWAVHRWDQQGHRSFDEGQRFNYFADSGDSGPSSVEAEGHVRADFCGFVEVGATGPAQDRSSVGGAAAESRAGRDVFVESDRRGAAAEMEGPSHEIVLFVAEALWALRADDLKRVTITQLDRVVEIKAHHFRVDQVIPIITNSRDTQ